MISHLPAGSCLTADRTSAAREHGCLAKRPCVVEEGGTIYRFLYAIGCLEFKHNCDCAAIRLDLALSRAPMCVLTGVSLCVAMDE